MTGEHGLGLRDMTKEEFLKIHQISVVVNPLYEVIVTSEGGITWNY